jgi:GT2 family glycosyltransferase
MPGGVEAVTHLNFSCTLIKAALFDQLGLFDERYVHYGGDYAWLHEAQAAGWDAVWVRDVYAWHEWTGNRFPEWIQADRDLFYSEWNRDGTRK